MVAVQVAGIQPVARDDGHSRIGQRFGQRCDDVARRPAIGFEHDDELTGRAPQRGLQRITRAEGRGGRDDLLGRARDGGLGAGHDEHLRVRRQRSAQRAQQRIRIVPLAGDDDDRASGARCFRQPRRDRLDGAVERATALVDVGRPGRLEVVAGAEVDHLPARGFDARLELVRGAVVAPDTCGRALVGQRDDVLGR
jgi:hypothetical protein